MVESNSSRCKENKFHVWLLSIIREVRKVGNSCWFAVRWFAVRWFALPFSSPLSPEAVWQVRVQIRHCYVQFCILWFWVSPGYLSQNTSPSDEEGLQYHILREWQWLLCLSFLYNLPWLILWLQGSSVPLRVNLGSAVLFLMCVVGSSRGMKESSLLTGNMPRHMKPWTLWIISGQLLPLGGGSEKVASIEKEEWVRATCRGYWASDAISWQRSFPNIL